MAYERKIIQLTINGSGGDTYTPVFLVPDGSSKITVQFTYASLAYDTTLYLEQSADGKNFDPVLDISSVPLTLVLNKLNPSATINIVNLLSMAIRFKVDFNAAETGSISAVAYLTE
jgi:hypothetical protein